MLEEMGASKASAELSEAIVREVGAESRIATPSELNRIADGLSERTSDVDEVEVQADHGVEDIEANQLKQVSDEDSFSAEFYRSLDEAELEHATVPQVSDPMTGEPMEIGGLPIGEDGLNEFQREEVDELDEDAANEAANFYRGANAADWEISRGQEWPGDVANFPYAEGSPE